MTAYYNEIDPFAAQWLRNLIDAGHIAPGVVDTRSIEEVTPNDLNGFKQCHFFAGIGVWSYALRRAGWADDRHVWTGSCPCQPFSQSGKRTGIADERHLWPHFHYLIEQCRPEVVFGEQVASKDGLEWFDTVQTDLEGTNYAATAFDICAAGVGAPHIRQRLFWVAHTNGGEYQKRLSGSFKGNCQENGGQTIEPTGLCLYGRLDDTECDGWNQRREGDHSGDDGQQSDPAIKNGWPNQVNGFWQDADWLFCHDGKWRPVKPGLKPLVNGVAGRVGQLRAYGNAICAEVAKTFISAYMDAVK